MYKLIFSILLLPCISFAATVTPTKVHDLPSKASPVASDELMIEDSANSWKSRRINLGAAPISTATQTALDLKENKAVVQASTPADTTVDWYDTDQETGVLILKRHNGTTWVRASSHGVQYASSCASITAGMCVDTDDGKLYYHNGTSVVEKSPGLSIRGIGGHIPSLCVLNGREERFILSIHKSVF